MAFPSLQDMVTTLVPGTLHVRRSFRLVYCNPPFQALNSAADIRPLSRLVLETLSDGISQICW